ncbi:MAG: DUF4397 domain-containing protein, partial [Myxococcota bacterium]
MESTSSGATISCPDGTSVDIEDGASGSAGAMGAPGMDGANGAAGAPGANGEPGEDGMPCTVTENPDTTVTITCPDNSTATIGTPVPAYVQIIHASADPGAATVDVWVNGTLLLDDFAFREGTDAIEVPAGTDLNVAVTASDATDATTPVPGGTATLNIPAGATWAAVATGTPDAAAPAEEIFRLVPITGVQRAGTTPETISLLPVHGIVDAPAVDIALDNGDTGEVDGLAFGAFTQDTNMETVYVDVDTSGTLFSNTLLADLEVDATDAFVSGYQLGGLDGLGGSAFIVVATGTLASGDFGLTAFPTTTGSTTPVVSAGVQLPESSRLQVIHNAADPNAASVDVYAAGSLIADNFA